MDYKLRSPNPIIVSWCLAQEADDLEMGPVW